VTDISPQTDDEVARVISEVQRGRRVSEEEADELRERMEAEAEAEDGDSASASAADAEQSDESQSSSAPARQLPDKRSAKGRQRRRKKTADEPTPEPEEDIRDLDSLQAKYKVGDDPEWSVRIYRLHPPFFPGNINAQGFYDEYHHPISEEFVAREYGGGKYEARIYGPQKNGNGRQSYARIQFTIPGPPNYDRLPTAVRESIAAHQDAQASGKGGSTVSGPVVQGGGSAGITEPPGLVQQAFRYFSDRLDLVEKDRTKMLEERRTRRDDSESPRMVEYIREISKEAADARANAEREAREIERQHYQQRERELSLETRRLREEAQSSSRSVFGDVERIVSMLKNDETTTKIMDSVLDKHRTEVDAMRAAHSREIESMRQAHEREMTAIREMHARDLEGRDRHWEARVQRLEDQLAQERNERRRDEERYTERLRDERDRYDERLRIAEDRAKEREESRVSTIVSAWESKYQTMEASKDNRIDSLVSELDRLRRENDDLRQRQREEGDVFHQIDRSKQLMQFARDMTGTDGGAEAAAAAGSIPEIFAKAAGDRLPQILGTVLHGFGVGGGGPQVFPGAPPGVMPPAMPPGAPPPRMMPPPPPPGPAVGPQRRPRMHVMPDVEEVISHDEAQEDEYERRRRPPRRTSRGAAPAAEPPPPPPTGGAPAAAPAAPPAARSGPPPVSQETVVIVAQHLAEAIDRGDDVREFFDKVRRAVPEQYLRQMAQFPADQVIAAIGQLQPQSEVLSPAGQRFTREVWAALQEAYVG